MKKTLLILAVLAASAIPAYAEKLTLTINQVFALRVTLAKLDDGVTHVIKQPVVEGQEPAPAKVVTTTYDFAPAVRLAIFRDLRALTGELEDFDKARASLVKKIWGDRTPDDAKDLEEVKRFRAELQALADTTVKVELTKLSPKELIGPGNPIPTQILLDLAPLLTE